MSQTTTRAPGRRTVGRLVAVVAVAAVGSSATLMYASTAGATVSSISTITAVSPHLVSALTLNQVITVTGTGFDESTISAVDIAGCTTDPTYIVVSATSLVLKTAADCAAGTLQVITITDSTGDVTSVPGTAAQALAFVTAPSIADATIAVHPVTTNNTAGMAYANQTTTGLSASTKGGTVIKVTAKTNPYVTSASLPFSASLGGVALTGITIIGAGAGNAFTGILGAHAADAAPVLKITNNGVSKSFPYVAPGASTNSHSFRYVGSSITVAPAFGASKGTNTIVITGAGFSTTALSDAVTVGATACPVVGTPTATSITCTVPAALTPFQGPVNVQVAVTGGNTSVIGSGSTYTYVAK